MTVHSKPSIFDSALLTLEEDPAIGLTSAMLPPLISNG